jgi:acetyl esterase/lipase
MADFTRKGGPWVEYWTRILTEKGTLTFSLVAPAPEIEALRPAVDTMLETARVLGASFSRTDKVAYGRDGQTALTFDVFQPEKPNGAAILYLEIMDMMSSRDMIDPAGFKTYLDRGYTVFAILAHSAGEVAITEIPQEIHRAVRFIRHNASKYGVAPAQFGISGFSSGGMFSLLIGTGGTAGNPNAPDPVDRESSIVQAVACFSPPTDLLNYGQPGVDAVDYGIADQLTALPRPDAMSPAERRKLEREFSPIYQISSNMPPVLIVHGDADKAVPLQQAESFVAKANKTGARAQLVVAKGKEHMWDRDADVPLLADWFDEHLRGIKK